MKIIRNTKHFIIWRKSLPKNTTVGFVPTMGALHKGHISLISRCRKENQVTVVSIFVNPLQFGPKEDFNQYPRPWSADFKLLKKAGVHLLFAPTTAAMYHEGFSTQVFVKKLSKTLCGSPTSRGPEHFVGVATVVAKLFNLVRPTRAYFGMKDFQQLRIIEQMNKDLDWGVKIVRCPTVREFDGLAMSSRNIYLSPIERVLAPQIYRTLQQGRKLLTSKPPKSPNLIQNELKKTLLTIPDIKIEYLELVNPVTLQKVQKSKLPILIAAAVKFKSARLIDNILVK